MSLEKIAESESLASYVIEWLEQICRQEVTHKVKVGPKQQKQMNMVLNCLKYDDNLFTSNK
jgi:hypothetical protein